MALRFSCAIQTSCLYAKRILVDGKNKKTEIGLAFKFVE
jgi:hypothetical protein